MCTNMTIFIPGPGQSPGLLSSLFWKKGSPAGGDVINVADELHAAWAIVVNGPYGRWFAALPIVGAIVVNGPYNG